jgi:hypothetical protein
MKCDAPVEITDLQWIRRFSESSPTVAMPIDDDDTVGIAKSRVAN